MKLSPQQLVRIACTITVFTTMMMIDRVIDVSEVRGASMFGFLIMAIAFILGDQFQRSWIAAFVAFLFGVSVMATGLVSGWTSLFTIVVAGFVAWGLETRIRTVRRWHNRRPYDHTER